MHKYLFTALRPLGGRGLVKLKNGLSDRSETSHPSTSCKSSGFSLDEREYLSTRRGHKAQSHPELLRKCHSPWLWQSSEVETCCEWIICARWSYHLHALATHLLHLVTRIPNNPLPHMNLLCQVLYSLFLKGQCTLINMSTQVHHVNVPDLPYWLIF